MLYNALNLFNFFMNLNVLVATAKAMVAPGKGILAIDESHRTCAKRFEALGVPCTEDTRRDYRELLITAPQLGQSISGMILFDETLRQKNADGVPFPELLEQGGMIPGIKVDTGTKELALHPGEQITEGLDGLRERLAEYKSLGARFAKWRAVITIDGDVLPSTACIRANVHSLARYAAICQEADIVPMVEPEILLDGDHSIQRCADVSRAVWTALIEELLTQGVALEGTILKTSMVLAGKDHPVQSEADEVAKMTVESLMATVPSNIGGVVFLSGGQSPEKSALHLSRMHQLYPNLPWPLSFSYGRGIQEPALKLWAQDRSANVLSAQSVLNEWARKNAMAAQGQYN